MKLIVGLGNIGEEYSKTRHNVGFMAIDYYASKHNIVFKEEKTMKGFIAKTNINGEKVIFLKPTTYMNLSGDSLILVKNYYKIDIKDILVINDDLDMPVGKVRFRASGSAGGHNGLKSIIANLGTQDFRRIKIGIDRSKVISVVDYVLSKFSIDDLNLLETSFEKCEKGIDSFILGIDDNKLSNIINS